MMASWSSLAALVLLLSPLCYTNPTEPPLKRQVVDQTLEPVLTTISKIQDLSVFATLIDDTGREAGVSAPEFDERFNNLGPGPSYTVFAPTNNAFESISPEIMASLGAEASYPLLASLLRTHIAQGNFTLDDSESRIASVPSIEGFPLNLHNGGSLAMSEAISVGRDASIGRNISLVKDENGQIIHIPASNGRIYKIDGFLNPYASYFGIDTTVETSLPQTEHGSGTMADLIREDKRFSKLSTTLQKVNPDFLRVLSLYSKDEGMNEKSVYLAPVNAAFDAIPEAEKEVEPSASELISFLLGFGLGTYDEAARTIRSFKGYDITINGRSANNAAVERVVCVGNGCVWYIGRWLDPLFGLA